MTVRRNFAITNILKLPLKAITQTIAFGTRVHLTNQIDGMPRPNAGEVKIFLPSGTTQPQINSQSSKPFKVFYIGGVKATEQEEGSRSRALANLVGLPVHCIRNAPCPTIMDSKTGQPKPAPQEEPSALVSRSALGRNDIGKRKEFESLYRELKSAIEKEHPILIVPHSGGCSITKVALRLLAKELGTETIQNMVKACMVAAPDNFHDFIELSKVLGKGNLAVMSDYDKDHISLLQVRRNDGKKGRLYCELSDFPNRRQAFALSSQNPLAPLIKLSIAKKYLRMQEVNQQRINNGESNPHEYSVLLKEHGDNLLQFANGNFAQTENSQNFTVL